MSLPKRIDMKVRNIQQTQNVSMMKVNKLIGFLLTFEITIGKKSMKKSKSLLFKTDIINCEDQEDHEIDQNMIESIVFLAKNFSKVIRRHDTRSGYNVFNNVKECMCITMDSIHNEGCM